MMGKMALTCVLALMFGFVGAIGAVTVFHDSFAGKQGATGLTGAPGPSGHDGIDGVDGVDGKDGHPGKRGPRGHRGKPGKDAVAPVVTDLGSSRCAGRSVSVVTDVTVTAKQKVRLTRRDVCIVTPTSDSSTQPVAAQ